MDKTAQTLLMANIYRGKNIRCLLLILVITVICYISTSLFFIMLWSGQDNKNAQDRFVAMDRKMTLTREQLGNYVDSMYGSRSLMQDAKSLFEAEKESEYLKKREEDSKSSAAQIGYLPGNLKKLFINPSIFLHGVTISSDTGIKAIWLDPASGDVHVTYDLQLEADAVQIDGFGDLAIKSVKLREDNSPAGWLGTITFWADKEDVFDAAPKQQKWVVMGSGFLYGDSHTSKAAAWLERAAFEESSQGWFLDGAKQPIFYTRMQSGQMDCSYIAVESLFMLCKTNASGLAALALALSAAAAAAGALSFFRMKTELRFLLHIMKMLESIETGRFPEVEAMDIRINLKSEYGMIVLALQNVSHELEDYIAKEYIMKLEQQETAMRALRHQINPHFLYNTLESIRAKALIRDDGETAEAIALLGSLYRQLLHCPETISLKEEFRLLELYLKMMSLRFAGGFVYQLQIEREAEEFKTISFWLQPLAENFFNYGIDKNSDFNLLLLSAHLKCDGIQVLMMDNGVGIPEKRLLEIRRNMYEGSSVLGSDIGLRNVYMRLGYFYGSDFKMDVGNRVEGGVYISIFLPRLSGKD